LRRFVISDEPGSEGIPAATAGAAGQALVAYSRFVPGAPFDSRRARARLLTSGDVPVPSPDAGPPVPAPDAGGSPVDPPGPPGGGDGCACRVGAEQQAPVAPLLLLGGTVALWLVRRRSAR
jgi:MYXO-CTERM domain-containing protein